MATRLAGGLTLHRLDRPSTGMGPRCIEFVRGTLVVTTVHDVLGLSRAGFCKRAAASFCGHWLPRVLPGVRSAVADSHGSKADVVRYPRGAADGANVIHPGASGRHLRWVAPHQR